MTFSLGEDSCLFFNGLPVATCSNHSSHGKTAVILGSSPIGEKRPLKPSPCMPEVVSAWTEAALDSLWARPS
jgi:hypothetical protein